MKKTMLLTAIDSKWLIGALFWISIDRSRVNFPTLAYQININEATAIPHSFINAYHMHIRCSGAGSP